MQLQYLAYQSVAELFGGEKIPPLTQTLEELTKEFEEGMVLKLSDSNGIILGSVRAKEIDNELRFVYFEK